MPKPISLNTIQCSVLESEIIEAIKTVYDPELPVNVYDLGLIYKVDVFPTGHVHVQMTLTSPACPVAGTLPGEVQQKVTEVPGVESAEVELVWDPPFSLDMVPDHIKLELGFF